ncbi:MAG: acetyl-CoA hydrolase/transferase C-terminal domain-containing protein [Pseudonocardia sp.]
MALPTGVPSASRIVPRIGDGPVTSLKSDVDAVVTERGVADIRAWTVSERAARLLAIAHPDHRAMLSQVSRGTAASYPR